MMNFRQRVLAGERLVGTFVKSTDHVVVEVLAHAGLDFICLDAEHSAYGRESLDAGLALARAHGLPALVRVPAGRPEIILSVLDSGATGIVVPHVDSEAKALDVAKAARFGLGGRGFAGSTRWAGFAGAPMRDLLDRSESETVVFVQIEEPAGVEACAAIAAVDGIDGLFIGPADLSVSYGQDNVESQPLHDAYADVGQACKAKGKALVTWAPNPQKMKDWLPYGVTVHFLGSDLSWILAGARSIVAESSA